ncbi:MAG: TaqI-like C-terminal specificity domain-containing protein, partial [Anaerolineales bacterium]
QCFQFELLRVFPVVPVVHICSPDLFSLPDQDIFCVHFFAQFHLSPLLSSPDPLLSSPDPLLSSPDPLLSSPSPSSPAQSPLLPPSSPTSLKYVRDDLCISPEKACQPSSGGFDIIIGNPPYIQLSMADYYNKSSNDYLAQKYSSSMGRLNSFGLFIEQGLRNLLLQNGLLSFIVPNTILTQEYYQALREQILIKTLVNITTYNFPVFDDAVVETVVIVVKNSDPYNNIVDIFEYNNKEIINLSHPIHQKVFLKSYRHTFMVRVNELMLNFKDKLDQDGYILKNIVNINQAIALKYNRSQSLFMSKEADNFKPVLDGRNIQRYYLQWGGFFLAYDVTKIHSCKRTDIFEAKEKIFFRRVGDRLIATYDNNQYYALNTLVVITLLPNTKYSIKYILGLINSNLLNYYYVNFLKSTKKVFSEIQARQLAQLPIREINFSNPADIQCHDQIVALVDRMLSLHQQLAVSKIPSEKILLQREIDITDCRIDLLVYKLYSLTDEEIRLVESG